MLYGVKLCYNPTVKKTSARLAQLVERSHDMRKVTGSSPVSRTNRKSPAGLFLLVRDKHCVGHSASGLEKVACSFEKRATTYTASVGWTEYVCLSPVLGTI